MYSLDRINTTADCDVLLTWAQKEKSDLLHKQYTIDRLTDSYSLTSTELDAELQGIITEITATTTTFDGLTPGPKKEEYRKKLTRLNYKKFVLESRKESYGSVILLEKELDLERINKEIAEVDVFISGVTAHKATL